MDFEHYVVTNTYCPESAALSRAYQEAFYRLFAQGQVLDVEQTNLKRTFVPDWAAGDVIQCFARFGVYLEPLHRYGELYGREQFYIGGFRLKSA